MVRAYNEVYKLSVDIVNLTYNVSVENVIREEKMVLNELDQKHSKLYMYVEEINEETMKLFENEVCCAVEEYVQKLSDAFSPEFTKYVDCEKIKHI